MDGSGHVRMEVTSACISTSYRQGKLIPFVRLVASSSVVGGRHRPVFKANR